MPSCPYCTSWTVPARRPSTPDFVLKTYLCLGLMHWTCIADGQCREGLGQVGGDVFMFSSTSNVEMEEPGQDIWLSKEHRKHQCCPPPSCASPGRQAASAGDLQFVFPRSNHESTTSRTTPLSTARLLVAAVDSRPRAKHCAHLCCCRLPGCREFGWKDVFHCVHTTGKH